MSHIVLLRRRSGDSRHQKKSSTNRHPDLPQLLRCRHLHSPFIITRQNGKMRTPSQSMNQPFLRKMLYRMSQRTFFLVWLKWRDVVNNQRKKELLLRMMHKQLALGFQQWIFVNRGGKQTTLMRTVLLRFLRKKQAMAWIKWRDFTRHISVLTKFVDFIVKRSRTGQLLLAFKRWAGNPPGDVMSELVTPTPRYVLGHCDCVYRLGNGLHCRCSKDKHLLNRLLKLRTEVNAALIDGRKEEQMSLAWPSRKVLKETAGLSTTVRRSTFVAMTATTTAKTKVPIYASHTFVTAYNTELPGALGGRSKISPSSLLPYRVRFSQSAW